VNFFIGSRFLYMFACEDIVRKFMSYARSVFFCCNMCGTHEAIQVICRLIS